MNNFYTLLTDAGISAITSARANGTEVKLSKMAVGDGQIVLSQDMTSLISEKHRFNINSITQDKENFSYLIIEGVIPSDIGGFDISEVAIYTQDDICFAIGSLPKTYKPLIDEGSTKDLTIRAIIEVGNAECVTLVANTNVALATTDYVDNLIEDIKTLLPNKMDRKPFRLTFNLNPNGANPPFVSINNIPDTEWDDLDYYTESGVYGTAYNLHTVRLRNYPFIEDGVTHYISTQSQLDLYDIPIGTKYGQAGALVVYNRSYYPTQNPGNSSNLNANPICVQRYYGWGASYTLLFVAERVGYIKQKQYPTGWGPWRLIEKNGSAVSVHKLATPRTIALSGDVTGSATFDGSANISIATSVNAQAMIPAGSVISFAGVTAPAGFLLCNGSAVSRTTYDKLFSAIGTIYGAGDDSSTFNLPDLRGRFVRGFDGGVGRDLSRTLGSVQEDAMQKITGNIQYLWTTYPAGKTPLQTTGTGAISTTAYSSTPYGGIEDSDDQYYYRTSMSFDSSKVVRSADETRPKNIAMNYIIKT